MSFIGVGDFQSVEVGEEFSVTSSQSKDCDLSFSSVSLLRCCRHPILRLFLNMVSASQ